MANILVTFFSGLGHDRIPPYYEGFINSLCKEGNSVLYIVTNYYLVKPWDGENKLNYEIDFSELHKAIKEFEPDVVFAFNNSCLPLNIFSEDVVICIMEADTYIYYNDKHKLKKHPDRFHYFASANIALENIPEVFGVKKTLVHKLGLATALEAENVPMVDNVSFIGSSFYNGLFKDRKPLSSETEIQKTLADLNGTGDVKLLRDHLAWFSYHYRCRVLDELSELGLTIYGKNWRSTKNVYPKVASAFNTTNIYTLAQNQAVYNSSYLCVNINHFQAYGAMPWRALDIMASNGCLVSGHSKNLTEFLRGYIDIPTFGSASEAFVLCKKLLADSSHREAIVLACQQAVKDKGRWHERFKEMESVIGIRLTSEINPPSIALELKPEQFYSPERRNFVKKVTSSVTLVSRIIPFSLCRWIHQNLKARGVNIPYKIVEAVYKTKNQ